MARQLIAKGHQVTMICAQSGNGDLGLPGKSDDPVRKGIVDGIQVIQFNLEYSNHMSLPKRSWIFLRYAFNSVLLALHMDYDLVFATTTPISILSIPFEEAQMNSKINFQFNFEKKSEIIDKSSQKMKCYETHFNENMLPEVKEVERRKIMAREKAYQLRVSWW